MIAFDLYKDLHRAGVVLSVDGDGLVVGHADRLTDELRAGIRQHKAQLIELLQSAHHTTGRFLDWNVSLSGDVPVATLDVFRAASLLHDSKL